MKERATRLDCLLWRCRRSGGMAVEEFSLKYLRADVRTRLSHIDLIGSSTNEEAQF